MIHLHQTITCHQSDVNCMDFSGNALATGSSDKTVRIFTFEEKDNDHYFQEAHTLKHECSVTCVAYNVYGTLLASGSYDGAICIWRTEDEAKPTVVHVMNHGSTVRTIFFNPPGNQLCSAGDGREIILWGGVNSSILVRHRNILISDASVNSVAYSPSGKFLVGGLSDGRFVIWNSFFSDIRKEVSHAHDLGVTSCAIQTSPSYSSHHLEYLLATGGNDDLVKLWKVVQHINFTVEHLKTFCGHTNSVYSVRFRSDAKIIVSTGNDHKIIIWDPATKMQLLSFEAHARSAITCCYIDDSFLATGSIDKQVFIWKLNIPGYFNSSKVKPTVKPKELLQWDVEEVAKWLEEVGFKEYVDVFRLNHVDGSVLLHMTVDDLEKSLKISSFGHRMKILGEIKFLKNPLILSLHMDALNTYTESLPNEFLCPITMEVMKDPVIAEDGNTYEREAITHWFEENNITSPITNEILKTQYLYPNRALLSIIKKYSGHV